MEFTKKQLVAMGTAAREFNTRDRITVSQTNLHDSTTVALEGTHATTRSKRLTILVSASGQTADLSTLDRHNVLFGSGTPPKAA